MSEETIKKLKEVEKALSEVEEAVKSDWEIEAQISIIRTTVSNIIEENKNELKNNKKISSGSGAIMIGETDPVILINHNGK